MLKKTVNTKNFKIFVLMIMPFLFIGCSEVLNLLNQMNVQEPRVNFSKVKMTGLSFDKVDLLFDINIDNPNDLGISLAGFDYDLFLNENSFIKGDQQNGLEIKAKSQEIIQLPISLNYLDIYKTFTSIKELDSINYQLKTGLSFNLPVLGDIRLPISKSGSVPTLKLPSISLNKLKMDKLGFTGADLTLEIKLKNPNAISMLLNNMNYDLNVSGAQWVQGKTNKAMNISAKDENIIKVPISLNFLGMGTSVYNMLTGNQKLNYDLKGNASLSSSLDLLGDFNLPFNQTGDVKIFK